MGGCPDRDRRHGHARHQAARASRTFAARLCFRLMRRFPAADDFHVALLTGMHAAPSDRCTRAPNAAGSPTQRAANTRRTWPWATSTTSPSAPGTRR